jgi:hypothetical protein
MCESYGYERTVHPKKLGLMEQPLLSDNYVFSLSLSLSREFPDLVPMLLRFHCGLHSE